MKTFNFCDEKMPKKYLVTLASAAVYRKHRSFVFWLWVEISQKLQFFGIIWTVCKWIQAQFDLERPGKDLYIAKMKSRSIIFAGAMINIETFRYESARVSGSNGLFWNPWWFYQVIWSRFHGTRPDKGISKAKMRSRIANFTWTFVDGNKRNSNVKKFRETKT